MDYYESDRKIPEIEEPRTAIHEIYEWVDCIVVAVVFVVLLFTFVFRIVGIIGPSMKDTLHENDKIIISNFMYEPEQGDIVVISRNYTNDHGYAYEEPIIKRVIAVEGQTVDIDFDKGIVYVDGSTLDEPYTRTLTTNRYDVVFPVRIGENQVFVLGDNRLESLDSRSTRIGIVDKRYVLGKAVFRIYPFNKFGGLYGDIKK
ncbi:MAG: signal peptidase I [Oscillospiraceae bacterium]